ncbi:MAG TPA: type II toxin-antitoxin system VapC family toxin [Gammaproteobacteria bacterium]|nr:type II toxin-antitoxin system VapC family toxin [Gammaproteobacteria bacterium]
MILVDTSVWIDHLRYGVPALSAVLQQEKVLTHPFVLGEIACGNLKKRTETLIYLKKLPSAPIATDAEVLAFIERGELMGRGVGYMDAHMLAATALGGRSRLWTRDKRLAAVAAEMGFGVDEAELSGGFRVHEPESAY